MRLRGGPWEMEVRPERGGRITSLRLAGEELLDQGIGVDDHSAEGFVAGGAWGWDEMVPNVEAARYPGPGPFEGVELPDHGEAWRGGGGVVDASPLASPGRLLARRLVRGVWGGGSGLRRPHTPSHLGCVPSV